MSVTQQAGWYAVGTHSGKGTEVAQELMRRIEAGDFHDRVLEVWAVSGRGGRTSENRLDQVLVRMVPSEEAFSTIRSTKGVSTVLGSIEGSMPIPLPDAAVASLLGKPDATAEDATPEDAPAPGETVQIVSGSFKGFEGKVESVVGTVATVQLEILGKATSATVPLDELRRTGS